MVFIETYYSDITQTNFNNTQSNGTICYSTIKKETKKQRISRIAKEKMLSSWNSFNQKTLNIKEIKQICKPKNNIGLRVYFK